MLAKTPTWDRFISHRPHTLISGSGLDVGLPAGQMGNSEVGHVNMGAGRVVEMELRQIDLAIKDQSFFENPALQDFISSLQKTGGKAHINSLLSDAGGHGPLSHLIATLKVLSEAKILTEVHAITDGRDVAPRSALKYLYQFQCFLRV